jgi:hypothetical protein
MQMTEDAVWEALARALSGEYDIVGRIGIGRSGAPVYLARELVTGNLVALRLPPLVAGTEARESGLEIVRQIDASLPEIVASCAHCGAKVRQWARFCTRCGRDISGLDPSAGQTRDQLHTLAQRLAAGKYEILGDMTRADGGGLVFFGRQLSTGEIVGLQLELGPDAVITMTTTQFAAPDPTIHIPEARHASSQQAARRVSVAKDAEAIPGPASSESAGSRRLAIAAVILLLVMGLVATCQIL